MIVTFLRLYSFIEKVKSGSVFENIPSTLPIKDEFIGFQSPKDIDIDAVKEYIHMLRERLNILEDPLDGKYGTDGYYGMDFKPLGHKNDFGIVDAKEQALLDLQSYLNDIKYKINNSFIKLSNRSEQKSEDFASKYLGAVEGSVSQIFSVLPPEIREKKNDIFEEKSRDATALKQGVIEFINDVQNRYEDIVHEKYAYLVHLFPGSDNFLYSKRDLTVDRIESNGEKVKTIVGNIFDKTSNKLAKKIIDSGPI